MVEKTRNRNANNMWSKVCTRLVHVVITISIATVLLVKDTVLREHFKNHSYLLPVSFILAVILSVVLYFTVACMDPGYVKREDYDVEEIRLILDDENTESMPLYQINNIADNLDLELNDSKQLLHRNEKISEKTKILGSDDKSYHFNLDANQRCGLCGLQRPLRAKHCRECKHCVRKFDHHCPWITNCVGERNHRFFWIFLFFELFLLCWGMYISTTGYAHKKLQSEWISQNILLLFIGIMMGILMLVVVTLLGIHTYLLLANQTTWEQMSRNRISYLKNLGEMENPFHLGMCGNIYTFFCHFKPYNWNIVYSKAKKHERVDSYDESDSDKETEMCEIKMENN